MLPRGVRRIALLCILLDTQFGNRRPVPNDRSQRSRFQATTFARRQDFPEKAVRRATSGLAFGIAIGEAGISKTGAVHDYDSVSPADPGNRLDEIFRQIDFAAL